ncbi:PQQ-dependent sugar dehydrogenase [Alteromonas sp. D210916BOD_24]|uniref:PQQ-dependent sugar dehydrogenase n=1 Tax=Alteromonas sp. D210916BOD_24 TaxID=3157618 RepID=UPI00399C6DD7
MWQWVSSFSVAILSLFFCIEDSVYAGAGDSYDDIYDDAPTSKYTPSSDATSTFSFEHYVLTELLRDLHYPKAIESIIVNKVAHHADSQEEITVVAERDGALVILTSQGNVKRFPIALEQLYTQGQGGVIDLLIPHNFADTGQILLSYSKGNDDANKLAVVKARLSLVSGVSHIEQIFEVKQSKDTPVHYGGKMVELAPNAFLITSGDGFDYREQAQRLQSHLGKVIGFTLQGEPLENPPFPENPYIYTLGHRNPQGLVIDDNGQVYQHEHGPDGGDEFNLLTPGQNYGWPVVTLGKDYSGARISPFTEYPGMTPPLVDWTPSIAPSAMLYYTKEAFPSLQQSFLVTSLKAKTVYMVRRSGDNYASSPIIEQVNQRIRDITSDSQGNLFILTDGHSGSVIKVSAPAT